MQYPWQVYGEKEHASTWGDPADMRSFIYKAWLKQDLSQEVRRIHSTGAIDGAGKGGTLGGGSK